MVDDFIDLSLQKFSVYVKPPNSGIERVAYVVHT